MTHDFSPHDPRPTTPDPIPSIERRPQGFERCSIKRNRASQSPPRHIPPAENEKHPMDNQAPDTSSGDQSSARYGITLD